MPQVDCTLTQGGGRSDIPANLGQSTADPIDPQGGAQFYLFRPALGSIPGGSTITSAVLRIYAELSFGNNTITLYNCLRAWVTGETSHNNFSAGNAWGTAGCLGSGTDRSASSIGSRVGSGTEDGVMLEVTVGTATVQGWLDGTNNGMAMFGNDFADYSGVPDATNPPILRVDYTAPGGGSLFYPIESVVFQ